MTLTLSKYLSLQQAVDVLQNMILCVALMGKHIKTPAIFSVLNNLTHVSKKVKISSSVTDKKI